MKDQLIKVCLENIKIKYHSQNRLNNKYQGINNNYESS